MLLAGRFIIRDLAELGVNTALVALSGWQSTSGPSGGICSPERVLELAIALKCTPAIFRCLLSLETAMAHGNLYGCGRVVFHRLTGGLAGTRFLEQSHAHVGG